METQQTSSAKRLFLISGAGIVVLLAFLGLILTNAHFGLVKEHVTPLPTARIINIIPANALSYKGQKGVDALTLLKEKTVVVQDKSGLVVSINTRKADMSKKEYWAFFINGKLATVGPASYNTKNTDTIEWRISHY